MNDQHIGFRAAVVQTLAALGNVEFNIGLVQQYTEEAVLQGARLVVFPECMNTGYLFDSPEHCVQVAEPLSGKYATAIAELCRQYKIYIASGFTELDPSTGKVFNTGLLFDPSGNLILRYQKQFLATHDQNWFEWGTQGCPVVETELGKIGLLICFDGRIPEIARNLALQGAEVIVDMANFFVMDQADLWVPARSYENGIWFVASTKAGVERSIYYPGGSMIVAPSGQVNAYIPYDQHGVVSADVFPEQARKKRWFLSGDRFVDRRPHTYGLLRKPFEETPVSSFLKEPLIPEQTTTKAAAVQAHATLHEKSLQEAWDMIDHTAKLGVKVIALPQFFSLPSWLPSEAQARSCAQQVPIEVSRLSEIAKRYQCLMVFSTFEEEHQQLSSAALVIGPTGDVIGRYLQVHLEPEFSSWCQPGTQWPVFETPFGRLGVILGYDGMFPESVRILALQGADIIVWPCAWRHPFDRKLLTVPKAEDNRVFVVCANRTDAPYSGGSLIIPPNGFPHWDLDVTAPPDTRYGAVMPGFVNLALARQKSMIPKVDMLRNRMVETYAPLVAVNR